VYIIHPGTPLMNYIYLKWPLGWFMEVRPISISATFVNNTQRAIIQGDKNKLKCHSK
jgi:hypothetical protein